MPLFKLMGKVGGGLFVTLLLIAVLLTVSALFWGWILMLVLGVLHHSASSSVPAWGYGTCFPVGYLLAMVLG